MGGRRNAVKNLMGEGLKKRGPKQGGRDWVQIEYKNVKRLIHGESVNYKIVFNPFTIVTPH